MRKILKIIFVLSCLVFFPSLIQASCTNPVAPSDGATAVEIPVFLDWCDDADADSYYIKIYEKKDGELKYESGVINSEITIAEFYGVFTGLTAYEWKFATCTDADFTNCGENCAASQQARDCADFYNIWSFTTENIELTPPILLKPFYDPSKPAEIPVINLSDSLQWQSSIWPRSYIYELKENVNIIATVVTNSCIVSFDSVWNLGLELNTEYNWRVKPCLNEDGTNCSEFSESWFFKTTGVSPDNLTADNAIIPVKIDWDDINGAISYIYEVSADNSFSEEQIVARNNTSNSEAAVDYYPDEDYPGLVQDTPYWWRVKTCADEQSNYCGIWSSSNDFTTFNLNAPCVFDGILDEDCPSPKVGGDLYTYQKSISWQSVEGAKAYKYKIDYATKNPEEMDETCVAGQLLAEGITTNHSVRPPLKCLGTYNWWLRSCLDINCVETSILSPMLTFTFIQPIPPAQFGLVPCGRVSDNSETPWNERDPCEIKHIFLLLKNIIDFVLWRVGLIALAFLIIFTAITSYFSLGAPGTIVNIKQIWQRAGKGYLIMFLAWWIINIIVNIVGFTDTWWSLPF